MTGVKDKNLTVVDFFCGAGGFSEGFRQMGFKIIQGYDNWQPAIQTFNHNFHLNCSIKNILDFFNAPEEIDKIPNTTIIIGSPPCVSFSTSNKSGKADKALGIKLIHTFLQIVAIKKHQPNSILKGWFMENVVNSKNFLQDSYTFKDLHLESWATLQGIDFNSVALDVKTNTKVINSADYGSYQSRKRSISGVYNLNEKFEVPPITHSEKGDKKPKWKTLKQLFNKLPKPNSCNFDREVVDPVYPNLKIRIEDLTDHFYDTGLFECEWRQSQEYKENHHCMGKMSFPENMERPSRTITATKSGTSREGIIYKSEFKRKGNGEYRSPTIREIATIMGFPITTQFTGNLYTKWRLIGNAVCPTVSSALAKEFLVRNKIEVPKTIFLNRKNSFEEIINLNTYNQLSFEVPPRRIKNSKFRRHPIKEGNLTVTISNFNIEKKEKPNGMWYTSIQYGTGANYKHQNIKDGTYTDIEKYIVKNIYNGKTIINEIKEMLRNTIATSEQMQEMYELQYSIGKKIEPTQLIRKLREKLLEQEPNPIEQSEQPFFKLKKIIPTRQLLALFGVNMIVSTINRELL